ncbi:hypothetical protein NW768_003357 [Fusarium equiseti]|uniref:Hsp70 protein n=1 Tax=Fusarium equiseti TaxID=61235 RepID=A0ABQ8RLW5_FUSEQ|nr:hypothetical protein NW768_003357 [Fusarium equiseti]
MTANQPIGDSIIVGIDFGTTYSGIAWAYSREPDEIELVTSWEAELNHCSDVEKAPTQLLYSSERDTSWGYSVPADQDALKWFKLFLLDEEDIPPEMSNSSQIRHARRLLKGLKKDPADVIGCFLRKIWNHTIDSVRRSIGAELLKKSRFYVVITLPAIWPPYAQQRMKQAARSSGILDVRPCGDTTLRFISEPEAAALATIKDLSKRSTIKVGDTMVICDAGGGTVDLISYVVESTDPFVIKECVRGDGGLCGGVFLDENFLELIKRKVSRASWESVSIAEQRKFLNDGWEHGIKPQFSNQNRTWLVDLPDSCGGPTFNSKLKRRRTLELSSNDILSVYTPIVSKIEALVRRQTNAIKSKYGEEANYIILVGGFGRSSYLFDKLQSTFGSTILQSRGNKPWTAICRGAVVRGITGHGISTGLGVQIGARVARKSYGCCFNTEFDEEKHLQQHKYWNENRQRWDANSQMKWFLKEGDNMLTQQPVRAPYNRLYSGHIGKVYVKIYSCSEFPPPETLGPTVQELCEIEWTRDINLESLPTYTSPLGKVFHQLGYEIEMTCEDGTVDFTVYFEGKRVGAHNVEVQFR